MKTIKTKASKPKASGEPPKPKTVPADAVYDAASQEWELGARDE